MAITSRTRRRGAPVSAIGTSRTTTTAGERCASPSWIRRLCTNCSTGTSRSMTTETRPHGCTSCRSSSAPAMASRSGTLWRWARPLRSMRWPAMSPRSIRRGRGGPVRAVEIPGRERVVGIGVVVQGQPELLQIVSARRPSRRFPGLLNGWKQKRNEDADNGDDGQKLDQSEPTSNHRFAPCQCQEAPCAERCSERARSVRAGRPSHTQWRRAT